MLNGLGEVTARVAWSNGQNVALLAGRPGSVRTVVRSGDPVPGYSGLKYQAILPGAFNTAGEAMFDAAVGNINPLDPPPAFNLSSWKISAGAPTLLAAVPTPSARNDSSSRVPLADVTNLPYSGSGRLQFSQVDAPTGLRLADTGTAYYLGGIEALEFGNPVWVAAGLISTEGSGGRTQSAHAL